MGYQEYFKNKKITLMGLGLLGRGIGDAKFLAELGADLIVTDLKTEEELKESVDSLRHFSNIRFVLGEHRLEDFSAKGGQARPDLIIKAANVPLKSPYLVEAEKSGIPITQSTALFARFTPATIIGVTGTRGKSTVTHMIAHVLKESGKNIFLGGNVQGVSTLAHLSAYDAQAGLPESTTDEIAVLELDSWQLQSFGTEGISPQYSVFTTFMEDHQNYYKDVGGMEKYFRDKANIFVNQKADDVAVLGTQMREAFEKYGYHEERKGKVLWADQNALPHDVNLQILGEHNRYNAGCAWELLKAFGIDEEKIKMGLESFKGVSGRLQFIREVGGVKIYNDTTATTPVATVAALQSLNPKLETRNPKQYKNPNEKNSKRIILICGGSDKGIDTSELAEEMQRYCKKVVLLPGTGTDILKSKIKNLKSICTEVQNMEEAVREAMKEAEEGDVVLLSPGFASFGLFKNEYDRGEQFVREIDKVLIK